MAARRYRQHGFGLIEILVVMVIICILALMIFPRFVGDHKKVPGKERPYTPTERAKNTATVSYESQIRQAIMMYRDDNDGQNPPSLEELKRYQVMPIMMKDQVTGKMLAYNPRTGSVGAQAEAELAASGQTGSAPGAVAPPARNVGPGGVTLPPTGSTSVDTGGDE